MTFCQFCNIPAVDVIVRLRDDQPVHVCQHCKTMAMEFPDVWFLTVR